jgi:hypothetical protein
VRAIQVLKGSHLYTGSLPGPEERDHLIPITPSRPYSSRPETEDGHGPSRELRARDYGFGTASILQPCAESGARPDVAAIYGDEFRDSGYGPIVDGLPPGTYELAVFGWSLAKHGLLPAKLVPVTVR